MGGRECFFLFIQCRVKKLDLEFISLLNFQILEKLYGPDHIAIGHELLKLASIQLAMGDPSAVEILDRAEAIFSLYYGCHANTIFPHLQCHKIQARELVQ